jgi:hypothetical protein
MQIVWLSGKLCSLIAKERQPCFIVHVLAASCKRSEPQQVSKTIDNHIRDILCTIKLKQ